MIGKTNASSGSALSSPIIATPMLKITVSSSTSSTSSKAHYTGIDKIESDKLVEGVYYQKVTATTRFGQASYALYSATITSESFTTAILEMFGIKEINELPDGNYSITTYVCYSQTYVLYSMAAISFSIINGELSNVPSKIDCSMPRNSIVYFWIKSISYTEN